jgi:Ran GTPase-activating protein (RanGAP) involved in mRNA processing and transport
LTPCSIGEMAAVAPADPISIPTGLGNREVLDVGAPVFDLQKIDNPQASLHQCASRYGAQAIRSIFEKLEQKDQVASFEQLNLSDNNIGDEGAEWLLKGLTRKTEVWEQVGKNLKVLLMPRARMGAKGMQAIGELIGESTSLENVILSSNICDAEGVEGRFRDGLEKNRSVKSLCLAACRLGDKGAAVLCDGPLKAHPTLEHVSLQYNRFGVNAALSFAHMLASNKVLRFLDLSGNTIGPEGAVALVGGLKKNNGQLQRLSVSQNEIRLAGAKFLCHFFMAPEGKNLVYLDLRHNLVPYTGMTELRQELGKPMGGTEGWMLLFGERQLLLNR